MKYGGWIVALFVVGASLLAQDSQKPKSDYTWDELKRIEGQERTDTLQAQKDQLEKLMAQQKDDMDALRHATVEAYGSGQFQDKIRDLARAHSVERANIAKTNSDERAKLTEDQETERKEFQRSH